MKRHLDDGPPQVVPNMPNKEGLYSRANPVSPPAHIIGSAMSNAPPIMTSMQTVQNILHMSGQPAVAPSPSQPIYQKDASMTTVHYQYASSKSLPTAINRHKVHTSTIAVPGPGTPPGATSQQHFQRLKVEDALSYLDQVKFKFGSQPQVYNDFLDIMKEFKSQSIDTPGVIQRVSNLFKGHPELIVGFNTFLPPGYKIEVQSNEQGYAFQVSVSMPSPTAATTTLIQTPHHGPMSGQHDALQVVQVGVKPTAPAAPMMPRSASPPTPSTHYPAHPTPAPAGGALLATSAFGIMPISQQQAQMAVTQALNNVDSPHPTPQNQPVEFNHAINYVNKIKNRFQGQPDKYKKFLEILHTYQKEQRNVKEGTSGPAKHLTEAEVYSQVSKLFEHQEDLLAEFGQFLPDATSHLNAKVLPSIDHPSLPKKTTVNLKTMTLPRDSSGSERETPRSSTQKPTPLKRSPSFSSNTPKKMRMTSLRDVSLADAAKFCSLNDYALFDKVRRALKSADLYENFMRCILLFTHEVISRCEVVQLITPFLSRSPELIRAFKDFVGVTEASGLQSRMDLISSARPDRPQGDLAMEVDYTACKRLGASYCALPKSCPLPKTSGRTALCREVLNDTWVSFPTWAEDSTFVTSRKTIYEEYIYRCEDERFELDVVIETNGATIRVLEAIQKKISRMTPEESQKFRLDDCLGGTSPTIHLRAICRVYGDKAPDMIDGLKKSPLVAIPVVLRRLRAKDDEWREAQKGFNKIWREQNEKYYLKSLDHQGMSFKQTDARFLGSKSLYGEIEAIFEERHDSNEDGLQETGPHLILPYKDKTILDDASNLLIHLAKRLTGLQKEDKHKMKVILRQFLPDLFHHPRQELSDDEKDDIDGMDVDEKPSEPSQSTNGQNIETEPVRVEASEDGDESYTFFMTNNNWYLFLRLHHILCERLAKMYERAEALAVEEAAEKLTRSESTSLALRLKPKLDFEIVDYYPKLLEMVKSVLDNNMDAVQFEDNLREMFGIHAYIAFTLDKVVTYAVRQLQHIVCDQVPQACMHQLIQEIKTGGAGGALKTQHQRSPLENAYQKKIETELNDESCYKIFIYHNDCRLTIELLDNEIDEPESNESNKWAHYRDSFAESVREFHEDNTPNQASPSFVPRNIRSWKRAHNENKGEDEPMDEDKPPSVGLRMCENVPSSLSVEDEVKCRFRINPYKVLFYVKGDILYRRNALHDTKKCQRRVTRNKHFKFQKFLNKWVSANCTNAEVKACTDMLMGRGSDFMPNITTIVHNDTSKPPYTRYNRYKVEILDDVYD